MTGSYVSRGRLNLQLQHFKQLFTQKKSHVAYVHNHQRDIYYIDYMT